MPRLKANGLVGESNPTSNRHRIVAARARTYEECARARESIAARRRKQLTLRRSHLACARPPGLGAGVRTAAVTSNGAKFLSRGVCAVFLDENPRVLQPHRVPSCPRGHDLTSLSERLQRDRHAPRRQSAESMLTRHSAARATTHRGRAASLHSRRVRVTLTAQATPWTMFSLWIKWHVPSSMLSSEPMSPAQSLRSSLGSFGAWKVTTPVGRSILA
jgi:hypothetical protein